MTLSFVANQFLLPLVPVINTCMNSGIHGGDESMTPVSTDDVIEFIRCLIVMSFYRETPTNFFSNRYESFYPYAQDRSHPTFTKCMKLLKLCKIVG